MAEPPETPTQLPKRSWWGVLKRTVREFQDDKLTDWAAALTYYGILSIFPALLAVVSLLGLTGQGTIRSLIENFDDLAPGAVKDVLVVGLENLERNQGQASLITFVGLGVALWSASGYIAAFMRAANAVYDMPEGRPIWKTVPLRLAITVVTVILLAIGAVIVVFTGGLAARTGDLLGIGDTGILVWNIAKWPVLVLVVVILLALLYWAAPNVRHPSFRWITPGSALAVLVWIAASAGFAFYVANFSSYNETYGTLAGVVIFLIWLWVTNIAVLLGLELDAELQRSRAIEAGHPPDVEPYAEPRDM